MALPLTVELEIERICRKLEEVGEPISYTRFQRWHDFKDPLLSEALEAACDLKIVKWKTGNWYSLAATSWYVRETVYYPIARDALCEYFVARGRYATSEFFIEDTSRRDSKISGRWTRPDLTMVSHKTYAWTIGQEFDVTTFEIKRPRDANVLAVFEALSHSSAATRAYVVFPISEEEWVRSDEAQAERVLDECSRLGVGLFLISLGEENPKVVERLSAVRRTLDHEKCGDFLSAVLSDGGLSQIAKWKR